MIQQKKALSDETRCILRSPTGAQDSTVGGPEGLCRAAISFNRQFCVGQIDLATDPCLLPSTCMRSVEHSLWQRKSPADPQEPVSGMQLVTRNHYLLSCAYFLTRSLVTLPAKEERFIKSE